MTSYVYTVPTELTVTRSFHRETESEGDLHSTNVQDDSSASTNDPPTYDTLFGDQTVRGFTERSWANCTEYKRQNCLSSSVTRESGSQDGGRNPFSLSIVERFSVRSKTFLSTYKFWTLCHSLPLFSEQSPVTFLPKWPRPSPVSRWGLTCIYTYYYCICLHTATVYILYYCLFVCGLFNKTIEWDRVMLDVLKHSCMLIFLYIIHMCPIKSLC